MSLYDEVQALKNQVQTLQSEVSAQQQENATLKRQLEEAKVSEPQLREAVERYFNEADKRLRLQSEDIQLIDRSQYVDGETIGVGARIYMASSDDRMLRGVLQKIRGASNSHILEFFLEGLGSLVGKIIIGRTVAGDNVLEIQDDDITPGLDSDVTLGSSSKRFANIYVDSTDIADGATGSFVSADMVPKTVSVTKGIITSIS